MLVCMLCASFFSALNPFIVRMLNSGSFIQPNDKKNMKEKKDKQTKKNQKCSIHYV